MAASSSLAVSPSRPSRARSTGTAWSSFSSQAWLKFRLGSPTPLTRRRWPSGMPHPPCTCLLCRRAGRTPKTRTPMFECVHSLRAAAHRVGHVVAGNAVPSAEFLKLFEVKLIGHFPQRVVSRLRVTEPTQDVNQPLLCIHNLNPQAPLPLK